MGWDIWLVTEVDGKEVTIGDDFNYTHNTNPMLRVTGLEIYEVDGMKCGEFIDKVKAVVRDMEDNREKYDAMNPSNGWGSRESLLGVLREIIDSWSDYPSATVSASC